IIRLKTLRKISLEPDVFIQKLAFLTQLAVYKDIIPGYSIRELTNEEKNVKVSKDVQKVRKYEESLLSGYKSYIKLLETQIMAANKLTGYKMKERSFVLEVQCLTQLMTSVPHFNYRSIIMNDVVELTNVKYPPEICEMCCTAICTIFTEDESGAYTLELVKLLSKMIKTRSYAVDERVIRTFLFLQLSEDVEKISGASASKRQYKPRHYVKDKKDKRDKDKKKKYDSSTYIPRKSKKLTKEQEEIENELKEAEAVHDKVQKKKMNTETLKLVFVTYLRILKHSQTSVLLPAVLEGLAKFAHLININLFADLLDVLKHLSASQFDKYKDGTTTMNDARSSFHCIVAALRLLTTQGAEIQILDLKEFSMHLYGQLLCLASDPEVPTGDSTLTSHSKSQRNTAMRMLMQSHVHLNNDENLLEISKNLTELAFSAFDLLFATKKNVTIERLASFVKRLATVIIHLPSNGTLAGLSIIRNFLTKYPRLDSLLDHDDRYGNGQFKASMEDPDLANALLAGLWELHVLIDHYHPTIRKFAKLVLATVNQSSSSDGTVVNYKPLPAEFNLTADKFLKQYNWMAPKENKKRKRDNSKDEEKVRSDRGFKFIPDAAIPLQVATGIKRKKEKGIIQLKFSDSEFEILNIETQANFSNLYPLDDRKIKGLKRKRDELKGSL
ncbi:Nucleolar complex protein 3, partial [Nowakowskiella sp. JEL0078]